MSASTYQAIEDIERQLDACLGRVQRLEVHVRAEIDQQKEEMQKLRGQLRRALAAVSDTLPALADDDAAAEAYATTPEPFADLLPGSGAFGMPSALVFDDDPDFVDPFEAALPEVRYDAADAQDDAVDAPSAAWEAPILGREAPVSPADEPIADESIADAFGADEPPVAELGFAMEAEEESHEAPTVSDKPAESDEPVAEADEVEAEAPARSPARSGPVAPGVISNFIIPAEAFTSELDDAPSEPAAEEPSTPETESPRAARASEKASEPPEPMSEFDRLLDWSDFEPEGSDEPHDEPHDEAPAHAPSGDGMTATHAPARPTVRPDRHDRPVTVSRRVPEYVSTDDLDQKIGDDLTVITGIDAETQEALRHIGVISLDEIASWHPADAQRIAAQLGTASDREIFDVWVPEAQSALFDLFQQRLRTNRFHNLDEM